MQSVKKTSGPKIGKHGKCIPKSVTVPETLLAKSQKLAEKKGWTFSKLVTEALKRYAR